MKDITTRADLEIIMEVFYNTLLQNEAINYIFTEVAAIDIDIHLPVITDFWEQSLFNSGNYRNNVMQIHQHLNSMKKLTPAHFDIWLTTFNSSVDKFFEGQNAEKIKTRALSIATIMKLKLHN